MAYSYMVPRISPLMPGFDCVVNVPFGGFGKRLRDGEGTLRYSIRGYHEGGLVDEVEWLLEFRDGELTGPAPAPYRWPGERLAGETHPGILEIDFRTADGEQRLLTKFQKPFYLMFSRPGDKSFLSDGTVKYSNPRIISQIEEFGQFVDTYPAAQIDLDRDYGDSLVLVNPYSKPVLCTILSHDGRSPPRVRVPAMSCRRVGLECLLREGERAWAGAIQITANNRIVVSDCKHSISDPASVSDLEHLEPYRTDPTHVPSFQMLRLWVGYKLESLGFDMERI